LEPSPVAGVFGRNGTDSIGVVIHEVEVEESHRRLLRIL
jgi:hypothetical protein